jgi:hypothetical protein
VDCALHTLNALVGQTFFTAATLADTFPAWRAPRGFAIPWPAVLRALFPGSQVLTVSGEQMCKIMAAGTGIAGVANMPIGDYVLGHAVAVRRVAGGAAFFYDSEMQAPLRVASQRVALFAQPRDRPLSDEITSLIAPRCCSPLLLFLCSRWRSLRALVRVSCSAAASLLPTAAHHPLLLLFLLASGWGAPYRWHSALALLRLAPSHTSAMATAPG